MSADISDPKIKEAFDEVKNGSKTWVLLSYVPKSDTKLQVVDKGTGGINELKDQLNDGKNFFGLISFDINKTKKFAYIAWCGEGVVGMKKGLFNNHANDVGRYLKGFHVQINARNEDDLNEKTVVAKLTKATGASYDSGAKIQGEASKGAPASFTETKSLATKSNVASASVDKSDYNKKNESSEYWQKQREQEEEEKKQRQASQQRTTDYTKSAEREKFWAQQKEEPKPVQAKPQQSTASSNAAAARSKFQAQPEPAPAPAPAPAPVRQAPPPKKAAPPPPEPEPVPEPVQEEPQQQQEEQQWQEEPQQQHEEPPQQQHEEPPQQQQEEQQQWDEPAQQEEQQQWEEEPQQQHEEPAAEAQQGVGQCRALYDYDAQNEGDLSFHEADIINVLDKSDPNGWWQGELNGVTGYFPSNFVEEI